jgi:hypothetical protein
MGREKLVDQALVLVRTHGTERVEEIAKRSQPAVEVVRQGVELGEPDGERLVTGALRVTPNLEELLVVDSTGVCLAEGGLRVEQLDEPERVVGTTVVLVDGAVDDVEAPDETRLRVELNDGVAHALPPRSTIGRVVQPIARIVFIGKIVGRVDIEIDVLPTVGVAIFMPGVAGLDVALETPLTKRPGSLFDSDGLEGHQNRFQHRRGEGWRLVLISTMLVNDTLDVLDGGRTGGLRKLLLDVLDLAVCRSS